MLDLIHEMLRCLFMLPLQSEEVLPYIDPQRHHAIGWVLSCCGGAGVWVYFV